MSQAGSATSGGGGSGTVTTLTSNTGGAVPPTANNINVVGDNTTITGVGNPGTSTITFSVVGTGVVQSLTGNSGGAVFPLAGNIGVEGDPISATIDVIGTPSSHVLQLSTTGKIATVYTTDAGTAVPAAGILQVFGGTGISTSGSGDTITITATGGSGINITGDTGGALGPSSSFTFSGGTTGLSFDGAGTTETLSITSLHLPTTSSTNGQITINGTPILHTYEILGSGGSVFVGGNGATAGNFTNICNSNIGVGGGSLVSLSSNSDFNTAVGLDSLTSLQTGTGSNTALGAAAGFSLVNGVHNVFLGEGAGAAYNGSESNNIIIGASNVGTIGESGVIRIDSSTGGGSVACHIGGIAAVTPGGTLEMVVIDITGGSNQLGSQAIPTGTVSLLTADSGGALSPTAGNFNIFGGLNIVSSGSGSTITIAETPAVLANNYSVANSTPYVVAATDYYITVDTSTTAITIQLPNAPTVRQIFIIKDSAGNAVNRNITVTTVAGIKLIDAATTFVMNTNYQSIHVLYDGFGYQIF